MAERTTLARPYAEAAFATAREADALAPWSAMLELAEGIGADPRMAEALASPRLDAGGKAALFLSVGGDRFSEPMRNFVRILIEAERIELLPELRVLYETRRREAEGVAKVRIETARPLDEAQLGAITAALSKRFGKRIEATTVVDPELIGGARIAVGDTVIDGSVRGKLVAMKHALQA